MMTLLMAFSVFALVFCGLSAAYARSSRRSRCECRTAAEMLEACRLEARRRQQSASGVSIPSVLRELPIQHAAGHCGACGR